MKLFFPCALLMNYCVFLAHYKPKESSSPKVKNMLNSAIWAWSDIRIKNEMFRYSMWTLDYQPQNGKGQEELDDLWAKVWEGFVSLTACYKIYSKTIIHLMSVTHHDNFMSNFVSIDKTVWKRKKKVFRPIRNIARSSTN